ncbi:MAG: S1/P1 nuclease, partial [Rhodospirillaceae bacterium]
ALLFAACSAPRDAMAWDETGHRIIAQIADHYLLPPARDQVRSILAADPDKSTAPDIASAASWADKNAATADWHFAHIRAGRPNIPTACYGQPRLPQGTPASKGPAQACVIDKINQFARELADTKVSAGERALALKYLVNLVGDIHQPLRVADEGNNHGTRLMVTAKAMTPGDLFTFWDSIVVTRLLDGRAPADVTLTLLSRISPALERQWANRAPQLWALESYQLGVDRAYGMVRTYDEQGRIALQDPEIEQAVNTTALQLSRAGIRLAYVLNEALAPASLAAVPSVKGGSGDAAAGRQFASKACTVCHVISPAQRIDTMAPDFTAVANTDGISEGALREFLFGQHPTMPNIRLSQKQADDLVAYILSLKSK